MHVTVTFKILDHFLLVLRNPRSRPEVFKNFIFPYKER
jgi:hypothetical protein